VIEEWRKEVYGKSEWNRWRLVIGAFSAEMPESLIDAILRDHQLAERAAEAGGVFGWANWHKILDEKKEAEARIAELTHNLEVVRALSMARIAELEAYDIRTYVPKPLGDPDYLGPFPMIDRAVAAETEAARLREQVAKLEIENEKAREIFVNAALSNTAEAINLVQVETIRQLKDEAARFRELVQRLRQWDMLDVAADGPYWKREIDAALALENEEAQASA